MRSLCFNPVVKAAAVYMAVWRKNVIKLSSLTTFDGHCSFRLSRSDSDVQLFNVDLKEIGHIFQKFSDAKKLSVSDKLLRFPTTFTSEEQHTSQKKTSVVHTKKKMSVAHTETTEQMETADLAGDSLGERLKWLWSEIKLPVSQGRKASLELFHITLPQGARYRNPYSFGYRHWDKI